MSIIRTGKYKNCSNCNKKIYIPGWDLKRKHGFFCSKDCWYKFKSSIPSNMQPNWKGKTSQKKCMLCNKEFTSKEGKNDLFCSKKCSNNFNKKTGSKSYLWKGGVTPVHEKLRRTPEYKEWRKFVFERDNYECQICGQIGGSLRANHIKKFADYPELRTKKTNGITICQDCDLKWVLKREQGWESCFNFNLETRNYV